MRFDVTHIIDGIDVAGFERLYFDEAFNEALCEAVGLKRRLIRLHTQGTNIVREVQITPEREIPAPVAKILGGQAIAYTETVQYELGSGRGRWQTQSSVLADKITSDGEIFIKSAGGGIERQVVGHVTVRIFGLGGLIERFIVADVESSYEQAAQFTQKYLASSKLS
jgi:hypothetical protein